MEKIQTDTVIQFSFNEFQGGISVCGLQLSLVAPEHQDTNIQIEVTWQKWRTIAKSIMVHTRVLYKYINFVLIYTTDNIYTVLQIKQLVK